MFLFKNFSILKMEVNDNMLEFHLNSFTILIVILILFILVFGIGYKMVKYKSCGMFLFPLKDNLKGDHYYIIGLHSNQLFRPVPQCDITLVLLSATGKHQVIIKNEENRDESLLRLGTSLVLSSTTVCLGSVESMSLVIHGDPNRWKLKWIKITDVQHWLTWDFKIPNGVLTQGNYVINNFKGKSNNVKHWLRFHNWILLFYPDFISSRVGFLTLILIIFSSMLTILTLTLVSSFIASETLILMCLIGCVVSILIHLFFDILLHASQGSINQKNTRRFLMCFPDEWQIALSSAAAICDFRIECNDTTGADLKASSSTDEESLKSESIINIRQQGIQIVRQIPVEDFSIFFESGDFDANLWPEIMTKREHPIEDSASGSVLEKPLVFVKELDRIAKSSSMGFLSKIQEESDSVISDSPPSFAYSSFTPTYKRSKVNILNPITSPKASTTPEDQAHRYGYIYTFISKTSVITIKEPIVELSAEEEAAFLRVNIPTSDSDLSRPQLNSSLEMLFQDATGTMWMPKSISHLVKQEHLIQFFRHWQMIGSFLQVVDLKLSSLHAWYTKHMLMTNEVIVIERIRVEILRLLIIFQVSKPYHMKLSTKTKSVPAYCVRSAARFTITERPALDDHFQTMADILENFTIQVTMLVVCAMKDFVSVTRATQVYLSGTVQYDLQSVVRHFIEEIRTLHDDRSRKIRHKVSVGDRIYISPHVSLMPTSDGSLSPARISNERRVLVIKNTRSLQLSSSSRGLLDGTSYFSATDVPPGLEKPCYTHMMSAEILSDVSKFVDAIVTVTKEILIKESSGNTLYDFMVCRLINTEKNFRYCCNDFLLYLVTKLSHCISENVIHVLGKELHLHVRNILTANLIRVVQFVTEKLPDAELEIFKSLQNEGLHLFPISKNNNEKIEVIFRECVLRNCTPPAHILNADDLQNYKHDLWLLKLVESFVQHQWLDRSSTPLVHLVSKAMPMLNNKLVVGCKILDETLSLVEIVEYDVNNSGNDRPIPFEHKDFATVITTLYKRLHSVLAEIHCCFHELSKIYLLTKLTQSEQEYVDCLATNGIIRSYPSETVDSVPNSKKLHFTVESIIAIRDRFLLLPTPIMTSNYQMGVKLLLLLNIITCYGISFIFSFLSSTSTPVILCMVVGILLIDILFVQTIKSFFLNKALKWTKYRYRKKL